VNTSRRE